jgi:hypothetical protein
MEENGKPETTLTSMVKHILSRVPRQFKGERILSNKWFRDIWIATCKRMKLEPTLHHITNNSKWVQKLNEKIETL